MTQPNKEIVILSERFHPDMTSATGQYMTDIALGLQKRGLDVTVLTRKICDGGDDSTQTAIDNSGITIKRVPIPGLNQNVFVKRLFNWFTYLSIIIPLLLFSRPKKERKLVFVSYPTILPPLAWAVCRLRGWEYMYIIHDYHPEAAVELGYIKRDGVAHTVWRRLNQHLLLDATHLVALGPKMKERVVNSIDNRYQQQFDPERVSIIHNWAESDFIQPKEKKNNWFSKEHNLIGKFTLTYSGNIGKFHDLDTVVEATAEIDKKEGIHVLIIGEGDNKANIKTLADSVGVLGEEVDILPYQPWETVPYSLTAGDVSIVAVNPEFEGLCVSSKLYSALAAGQPVLVIAGKDDDESQIIEQFDAGIQVSPGDIQGVVDAISRWKNNPELVTHHGKNAREAFETHFTRENSVEQYYKLLADRDSTIQK